MMIEKDNGKILKMLEDEEDLKRELKAAVDTLSKHKWSDKIDKIQ